MSIEKLIKDAEKADSVASLMQDVNPHAVLELHDKLKAAEARVEHLTSITSVSMGVGNGTGNLFVHGDYDSIKAAQRFVFRCEGLASENSMLKEQLAQCDLKIKDLEAGNRRRSELLFQQSDLLSRSSAEAYSEREKTGRVMLQLEQRDAQIAALETTLEREREKSRRVMSQLAKQEIPKAAVKHYTGCKYPVIKLNSLEVVIAGDREDADELADFINSIRVAPPAPVVITDESLRTAVRIWNSAEFPSPEVYDAMRAALVGSVEE